MDLNPFARSSFASFKAHADMSTIIGLQRDMNFCLQDQKADSSALTFSEFFSKRALKVRWTATGGVVLPKALKPRIIRSKLSPKQQG